MSVVEFPKNFISISLDEVNTLIATIAKSNPGDKEQEQKLTSIYNRLKQHQEKLNGV